MKTQKDKLTAIFSSFLLTGAGMNSLEELCVMLLLLSFFGWCVALKDFFTLGK